jgi:flagellar hook-associated protein 1
MTSLISDLTQSAQALDAQQVGIQVSGNNLANIDNANYATESVNFAASGVYNEEPIGEMSYGVTVTGVTEARNPFLDAQVVSENSVTGSLQAQVTQLTTAQSYLGESVSSATSTGSISDSATTGGISTALNNFFNSFSDLATSPTDSGAKQTVVQNASTLASTINAANTQLTGLQSQIGTQITQDTQTANGLLQSIASLNQQIQQYQVQNPSSTPNDLIDQRQGDVQQLSQLMNITTSTIPNSYGQIQVSTLDANSNPVTLVSKTSVDGPVTFTGSGFTAGTPQTTLGLTGGSLQGNLSASTGEVQTMINGLQSLASQMTTAVNSAYNPGGTGNNFFASTPASGTLISLDPSLTASSLTATATANSGANELAVAVTNVQNQTFSTSGGDQINGTLNGFYNQTVTGIGESIDGAQSQLTDQTAVQNMVNQQQSSVSGVNQDEEMTNLITFQRAFEAQARVMNTINDELDTVVNGLFGDSN